MAEQTPSEQSASPATKCDWCGASPFPGVAERIVGDSPELCHADHKPPKWGRFTRCCNRRLDGVRFGYGNGVWPRIGF